MRMRWSSHRKEPSRTLDLVRLFASLAQRFTGSLRLAKCSNEGGRDSVSAIHPRSSPVSAKSSYPNAWAETRVERAQFLGKGVGDSKGFAQTQRNEGITFDA